MKMRYVDWAVFSLTGKLRSQQHVSHLYTSCDTLHSEVCWVVWLLLRLPTHKPSSYYHKCMHFISVMIILQVLSNRIPKKTVTDTNPTSYNQQDQRKNDNIEGLHMQLMGMMSYWSLAARLIPDKLRAPIAIQSRSHLIANLLEKRIN